MYYLCCENKGADQLRSTAKLICAFVFAYADCWLSHGAAQIMIFNAGHSTVFNITNIWDSGSNYAKESYTL